MAIRAHPWGRGAGQVRRHGVRAIKFTEPEPQKEPKNLRKLRKAIRKKWGTVALIDILKEAALRTGMLKALAPAGTREAIDEAKLLERLLLIAYAYGTNSAISSVASGEHKHTEEEPRYTARRYLTAVGLKAAGVEIANATFAARSEAIWGQGTTTAASDSTHFKAWDRNILTEWHSRYGGRGVLVYWHIEKGSMAIHSQLLNCTASEVAAAIEGMMRHATTMQAEGNYVDSRGQSEIGFGLTRLLGYDLLPRIKQINKVTLYRPGREDEDNYDEWADLLTDEDKRALTPLFWMHIQPYGEVRLNMGRRLQLAQPVPQEPDPEPAAA
ncbi:Tn3 family transposase [Streptomyces sp. H27-C3]|uniref:Tn3 family transposase n=1 Tax=Streptomyces sp. H27-C3 TaxID=3046305 RepID=UPI0024BAA0CD|nr:Tn3 family transposase [Streptomyces sp. H27-C3]MDJ0465359.1 Tn3 family transposase [Streptomyces sp. H27-C3]